MGGGMSKVGKAETLVLHEPNAPRGRCIEISCARGLIVLVIEPANRKGNPTIKLKLPTGWRWKSKRSA